MVESHSPINIKLSTLIFSDLNCGFNEVKILVKGSCGHNSMNLLKYILYIHFAVNFKEHWTVIMYEIYEFAMKYCEFSVNTKLIIDI